MTKAGKDANNSAFECGKIVNLLLKCMTSQKSKLYSIVSGHKDSVMKKIKGYFDFFNKVMIDMYEIIKINGFLTQKFEVYLIFQWIFNSKAKKVGNPIGGTRMMLFETLYYLAKITIIDKQALINEINASIWHMIVVWFFSNRFFSFFFRINSNFI